MVKKAVKKVAKTVKKVVAKIAKVAEVAKKTVKGVKKPPLAKAPQKTVKVAKVTKVTQKTAKVVGKAVSKAVGKTVKKAAVKKTISPKIVKVSQPVRKIADKANHVSGVSVKKLPPVSPPKTERIVPKHPVKPVSKPVKKEIALPTKGLTPPEIEAFQAKLLALRSQLRGQVSTMTDVALDHSFGDLSAMPLHMADIGSDNYEQEQTLAFIESDSNTLIQIEEALQRIKEGTFGVCEDCGCFIPKPRLNFLPFAAVCVKCVDAVSR